MGAHLGNVGVLLRAYAYARMLGREGMRRVGEFATLNANYLMTELRNAGFEVAFPERRASHEFIVTLKGVKADTGVTAMDVAKRLLDKGCHAPTTYFPQLVPECLLIEPSETESKQTRNENNHCRSVLAARHREDRASHDARTPSRRRQGRT
jgi:glycine dehydrogenase subunit 2